jgi:hypothetical protein
MAKVSVYLRMLFQWRQIQAKNVYTELKCMIPVALYCKVCINQMRALVAQCGNVSEGLCVLPPICIKCCYSKLICGNKFMNNEY